MGTLEHAIRWIEMASTKIVAQGYLGIFVDTVDFYDAAAELIHIEDTRGAVSEAQRALYERKNVKIKAEKMEFEEKKSARDNAKLNLETEKLVDLKLGKFNNLAQWISQILKKHKDLEKYHSIGVTNLLHTIKARAGPLKEAITLCKTIPDVMDYFANQYLRGSEGLETILNLEECKKKKNTRMGFIFEQY